MPSAKSSVLLTEMRAFVANHALTPYAGLLPALDEAGYWSRLEEIDAVGQADGMVLVRFKVYVGREDASELFDTVTVKVGNGPGPVSVVARRIAADSLANLFFGRWPETIVNVAAPPAGDIKLPGEDPLPPEEETEQEYVDAPPPRRGPKMPSLIDHVEPDGVPVFIDLDDVPNDFTSAQIVEQFLADVNAAALKFTSKEQLIALFTKNEVAIGFIKDKDVATDADREAFTKLMDDHEARIEANATPREVRIPGGKGSTVPRRRRAA